MAAPIRIAVDARSLLCAEPRGEGKSLLRLYQEVARQRPDIEPVLFGDAAAARHGGPLPAGASTVATAAFGDRWNAWEDVYFPIAARRHGCRLMHCTSSGAPWRTGMPMVMTVHDLIPLLFDDGHDAPARRLFRRRLRHGMRQATRVLSVSAHTQHDLLGLFPAAAPRCEVVHWGADASAHPPAAPALPPTVLVFAGEARRKNSAYSLDRWIAAAARVPGLRLQMIGVNSAHQRLALQQRADAAGLGGRVEMPGFVSEADLAARMRQATLLLYLSLYEGFGLPLLEAVAHGVPVVASDCTSIPEVLGTAPGCHALDAPRAIEDTIVALATDAALRRRYCSAQAAILSRFDWCTTAQRVAAAFDAALSLPTTGKADSNALLKG